MQHTQPLALCTLLTASIACGEVGPHLQGPPMFRVTIDGAPWPIDTMGGILWASPCDTTLVVSATGGLTTPEERTVVLVLHAFPMVLRYPIADSSAPIFAMYSTAQLAGGLITSMVQYWSVAPGQLVITGVSRADSVVTGRFSFEAATIPDTMVHPHLSGDFRVSYFSQEVSCLMPPNQRMDQSGRGRRAS
jgi:hypothetical protein